MGDVAGRPDPETTARIEAHLPLVKNIVFQVAVHFPRHVDRDELARAGALGLVEAARRWDAERGVPFDRYAARRIKGAILDAVRAADWAPRSVRAVARRIARAEQELTSKLGRLPSSAEMAAELDVPVEDLARLSDRIYRSVVLALEQPVHDAGAETVSLMEVLRDTTQLSAEDELEARELVGYLHDAIELLPGRHRIVIVGYFLDGRTSVELAGFLGVTESRISQLRSEALELLRAGIGAQYESSPGRPGAKRRLGSRLTEGSADYAAAIAGASPWQARLSRRPQVVSTT
jgi:RNA polymerase sigma factor FliA